jgi:hypothetical protein
MKYTRQVILGFVLSTVATGCDDADDEHPGCSLEAVASVVLDVVDAKGETVRLEPGSVTFTVDGGEPRTLEAEFETIEHPVTIFASYGEVAVTVAAEGYEPATITAVVAATDDGCHAVTEFRELVLTASGDGE